MSKRKTDPNGPRITASDALIRLSRHFSIEDAKLVIAERLKRLELNTMAKKTYNFIEAHPVIYTHNTGKKFIDSNIFTPQKLLQPEALDALIGNVWQQSINWKDDFARWIWTDGNFFITYSIDPLPTRWALIGVTFLEDELEDISKFRRYLPEISSVRQIPQKTRPQKWDWEGLLIELLVIADLDGLTNIPTPLILRSGDEPNLLARGGQAVLERWIANYFSLRNGGRTPAESEIQRRAKAIREAIGPRN